MHFKWILLISSCLILSVSSARRGGSSSSSIKSTPISRGATNYRRTSPSLVKSNPPRFISSPSLSGRGPRTRHIPKAASAPPLSSLPSNTLHVPQSASAPPLSSIAKHQVSSPATTGSSIPKPPPPPPSPAVPQPQNVAKSGFATPAPSSQGVITPMVVSSIMRIPPKRNATTNGNSPNSNTNLSKPINNSAWNTTTQTKLPPLNTPQNGKNSTGGLKSSVSSAKTNSFNSTIKGSPKNATSAWSTMGNGSGGKLNGTIVKRNFTLNANAQNGVNASFSANHTRHNNSGNYMGHAIPAEVGPITQKQPANYPLEGSNGGNPQQSYNNNKPIYENPPQQYDDNNGEAPRVTRNNGKGDLVKKLVKSVATQIKSSPKTGTSGLNSDLNGQSWDANHSEFVRKSSVIDSKSPSKIMKYQIVLITVLVSIVLAAAGVIVYVCNRK